ncbi:hypothetical protein DFH06DRAFT_1316427 [Mycena polygramma]|nr:hypothetical protein DFH06DRAFT_1316427 [Mycena polygramma]
MSDYSVALFTDPIPAIAHLSETDDSTDESSDDDELPVFNEPAAVVHAQDENLPAPVAYNEDQNMSDESDEEEIPLRIISRRKFLEGSGAQETEGHDDDEQEEPRVESGGDSTISQIDADSDELAECDICGTTVGPQADVDSRVFRCGQCVLNHHSLQEWDNVAREWGNTALLSEILSTMAKICSACEIEVAARNAMPSDGTFIRRPLHRVKVWGGGWHSTTLAEEGLIHHLGHQGQPCLWPVQPPVTMMVMAHGVQWVTVQFCGCGNFEPGPAGEWSQIVANGWFRAGLIHPRVCSTFRVMRPEQEAEYLRAGVGF